MHPFIVEPITPQPDSPKKVFIMRNEGHGFPLSDIRRTTETTGAQYNGVFKEAWTNFNSALFTTLSDAFAHDENSAGLRIESYPLREIKREVLRLKGDRWAISTDPCIGGTEDKRIGELGLSRIYQPGGMTPLGFDARPGYLSVKRQLDAIARGYHNVIKSKNGDKGFVWIEDDIWTGQSVKKAIEELRRADVPIDEVVTSFQVGTPDIGVPVRAVITYAPEIAHDLADHRDFLIGARESGLVVVKNQVARLDATRSGVLMQVAKAPYILPWISPHARSSIPPSQEVDFSKNMLQANIRFYELLAQGLGESIRLHHINPHVAILLQAHGFQPDDAMEDVVRGVLDDFDEIISTVTPLESPV